MYMGKTVEFYNRKTGKFFCFTFFRHAQQMNV